MNKHSAMNKKRMSKITKQQEQNTEWKRTAYSGYNKKTKTVLESWKMANNEKEEVQNCRSS